MTQPLNSIQDLLQRVASYPWWGVLLELTLVWVVVYAVVRFVQGTRAAGALKGMVVLFVAFSMVFLLADTLGQGGAFQRIGFLFDKVGAVLAVGLIVVFQPELRRALIRLGEASFFRSRETEIERVVDAVADACGYLAKARFGAIIAIERQVGLSGLVEGGTTLNAEVSPRLLQTIFHPGTALHDLAVVIRGRVVHAAGVQLPMAEPEDMPNPTLGARHRAAVGLSRECDAIVVVVSEETGQIRIAERGSLTGGLSSAQLKELLHDRLSSVLPAEGKTEAELEAESGVTDLSGTRVSDEPPTADAEPGTANRAPARGEA